MQRCLQAERSEQCPVTSLFFVTFSGATKSIDSLLSCPIYDSKRRVLPASPVVHTPGSLGNKWDTVVWEWDIIFYMQTMQHWPSIAPCCLQRHTLISKDPPFTSLVYHRVAAFRAIAYGGPSSIVKAKRTKRAAGRTVRLWLHFGVETCERELCD